MRWRGGRPSRSGHKHVRVGSDVARTSAGYGSADEYDTPAEVDATFRTVRRVAVGYFAVFLVVLGAVPGLTVAVDWWSEGRLLGGMSPSFVMAAFGLYVFFLVVGIAAATLSSAVEARMLGGPDHHESREGRP